MLLRRALDDAGRMPDTPGDGEARQAPPVATQTGQQSG